MKFGISFFENSWPWDYISGGYENRRKIEGLDFYEVSYTQGHEKQRKTKRLIFMKFHVPLKSWKLEKNEASDIFEVLCTEMGLKWNDWFSYLLGL